MATTVVTTTVSREEVISTPALPEMLSTETVLPQVLETPSERGTVEVLTNPARDVLLLQSEPRAVELVVQGPQGPQGETGPQGPPGEQTTLAMTQVEPSDLWLLTHRLGRFPSVTVIDSAGSVVVGDVQYVDADTITVRFSASFAGVAYLN